MKIKLVDGRHGLITETVIPNMRQIPSVILWDCCGQVRTFVRWDICDDEWVEASDWTVRGSATELGARVELPVSRR